MPCRYYTDDEERAIADAKRMKAESNLEVIKAQNTELADRSNKQAETIKQQIQIINRQEATLCKIFNHLYDNDLQRLVKILNSDDDVQKVFWEHQQIDMEQGRDFITKIGDKWVRVQPSKFGSNEGANNL